MFWPLHLLIQVTGSWKCMFIHQGASQKILFPSILWNLSHLPNTCPLPKSTYLCIFWQSKLLSLIKRPKDHNLVVQNFLSSKQTRNRKNMKVIIEWDLQNECTKTWCKVNLTNAELWVYILNTIYLFECVCQRSRLRWVLGEFDKGKGMESEVSGRKSRKRDIKICAVTTTQDYHTNPPLTTGVLDWIIPALSCCCTKLEALPLPTQWSPLLATPFLSLTQWFCTKLTDLPCSWAGNMLAHPLFLPSKFIALWCSAVTSQHPPEVVSLPYKTGPLPLSLPNPAPSCISALRWVQVCQDGCA